MRLYRPSAIRVKPDGQPAVEIENDGKKQQFVGLATDPFRSLQNSYHK